MALALMGNRQGTAMITRRTILMGTASVAAVAVAGLGLLKREGGQATAATKEHFEVAKTKAEWRKILSPDQYNVLREEDTERPWSSPLNKEKRMGTFNCAGCDLPVFASETKFESGTGWPSFYEPIKGGVELGKDWSFGLLREEVHCRRCGGHLGHVFSDGPKPTGLRYCINGLALKFVPA
jgi:peptide-methionine (R)-S-oxide reductase